MDGFSWHRGKSGDPYVHCPLTGGNEGSRHAVRGHVTCRQAGRCSQACPVADFVLSFVAGGRKTSKTSELEQELMVRYLWPTESVCMQHVHRRWSPGGPFHSKQIGCRGVAHLFAFASDIRLLQSCSQLASSWQDPPPYERGFYLLLRSAYVAYDADNFAPDDDEIMAELEEGDET